MKGAVQDKVEMEVEAEAVAEAAAGIDRTVRGRRIGAPPSRALPREMRSLFLSHGKLRRRFRDVVRLG
jgi:hypothetical protein